MSTVRSKDGTTIAYDRAGQGPALILVDGAMCYRAFGPSGPLARALAPHFTVYSYDRRGRGESGNTTPWAVEREVEDLEALVKEAGGSVFLYGISSGAALALEAANRLSGITRLALFEAPFIVDDSRAPMTLDWRRIDQAVAEDRRSDALGIFMRAVGMPSFMIPIMRLLPMWSKLKAVAPTLPYDGALVRDFEKGTPLPAGRWSRVTMPTLVLDGGKSPEWMRNAMKSLSQVLPDARYQTLPGQTHMVKPAAHAPVVAAFLANGSAIHA